MSFFCTPATKILPLLFHPFEMLLNLLTENRRNLFFAECWLPQDCLVPLCIALGRPKKGFGFLYCWLSNFVYVTETKIAQSSAVKKQSILKVSFRNFGFFNGGIIGNVSSDCVLFEFAVSSQQAVINPAMIEVLINTGSRCISLINFNTSSTVIKV